MKIKKPDVAGSLIKIFEIFIIPSLSVTWEEGGDQVQLPVVPPPCPILDPPHPDPTQCTTLTPLPTLPNSIPTPTILSPSCRKRVNCNRLTYTARVVLYLFCTVQKRKVTWKNTMGGLPSDSDSVMFVLRHASVHLRMIMQCKWWWWPHQWTWSLCLISKIEDFLCLFPVGPKFWKWNHTACNRRMIEEPNYRC